MKSESPHAAQRSELIGTCSAQIAISLPPSPGKFISFTFTLSFLPYKQQLRSYLYSFAQLTASPPPDFACLQELADFIFCSLSHGSPISLIKD